MLKFGLPRDVCAYIKLVAKLQKQWDRDEIRTRAPNSLERLNNVRTVFDKLPNAKAIYHYLMEKTAKLPLEQKAKWSELKDQNLQWNTVYPSVYNSTTETTSRSLSQTQFKSHCNDCSTTWVLYKGYRKMQFL